jgi:hypothetical protein
MKKVISIEELPNKTLYRKSCMGHKIYILDNGLKYKEYNQDDPSFAKYPYNKELIESLKEQINTQSSLVSFPQTMVGKGKKIYGVISPFEEGTTIEDIYLEINIYTLLRKVSEAEIEIDRLSKEGWHLDDINSKNIITNNNQNNLTFRIIDTDYYVKRTDQTYERLLERNRALLLGALLTALTPLIAVSKTLHNKKLYNNYVLAINGKIKPTEFFYEVLEIISRRNEVASINDLRKSL